MDFDVESLFLSVGHNLVDMDYSKVHESSSSDSELSYNADVFASDLFLCCGVPQQLPSCKTLTFESFSVHSSDFIGIMKSKLSNDSTFFDVQHNMLDKLLMEKAKIEI